MSVKWKSLTQRGKRGEVDEAALRDYGRKARASFYLASNVQEEKGVQGGSYDCLPCLHLIYNITEDNIGMSEVRTRLSFLRTVCRNR